MPRIQLFFVPNTNRQDAFVAAIQLLLSRTSFFVIDPMAVDFTCHNMQGDGKGIVLLDFTDSEDQRALLQENERIFDGALANVITQFGDLLQKGAVIAHVRCEVKFVKRVDVEVSHA